MKNDKKSFWVTNISNRNVMLSDLNLMIKAMSSINLLSSHHYLTEEQLNKSLSSGSLFLKRSMIVKRIIPPPEAEELKIIVDNNASKPSKQRSLLEIKIESYPELELSDNMDDALKQEFDFIDSDEKSNITKKG